MVHENIHTHMYIIESSITSTSAVNIMLKRWRNNGDDSRTKEVVHQKYFCPTLEQKLSDGLYLLDDQHLC